MEIAGELEGERSSIEASKDARHQERACERQPLYMSPQLPLYMSNEQVEIEISKTKVEWTEARETHVRLYMSNRERFSF